MPVLLWITLLALVVRAVTATWTGLAGDEANGIGIAVTGSWWDMFIHLREDGNPPLFYIIMRLYAELFGASDIALKIFVILLGTLEVPVLYLIARRFLSQEQALQLAMMLAFAPPVVRYGTMIRPYVLMPMMSLLSVWFFMRTLTEKKPIWPICYGVATTALFCTHFWGVFVAVGEGATVMIGLLGRWINREQFINWCKGVGVSVIAFLPWLPFFIYQVTHVLSPWDELPQFSKVILGLPAYFFIGSEYTLHFLDQLSLLWAVVLIWGMMISPVLLSEKESLGKGFDGRRWKFVALMSLLAAMIISIFKPVIRDRYFLPLTPLLAISYVTGFSALFPRTPKLLRLFLPILVWLPFWIPMYMKMVMIPETGTPAIVRQIMEEADRKKDIVVVTFPAMAPALTFYLPEDVRVVVYPDLKRIQFNKWDGMNERMRDGERLHKLFDIMQGALDNGGKVWLVDWAHTIQMRDPFDESGIKTLRYQLVDYRREDQVRTWLAMHGDVHKSTQLAPGRDGGIFLTIYEPTSTAKPTPMFVPEESAQAADKERGTPAGESGKE